MSPLHFLIVVASLAAGTLPPPGQPAVRILAASFGLMTGWTLLVAIAAHRCTVLVDTPERRGGGTGVAAIAGVLDGQLRAFRWIGLAAAALCLGGFGLGPWIARHPVLGGSMTVQAVLMLSPATWVLVVGAIGQWWFMWRVDGLFTMPRSKMLVDAIGYVVAELRCTLAPLAIPTLVMMGVVDVVRWGGTMTGVGQSLVEHPATIVAGLAVVVVTLPWLMRATIRRSPMDVTMAHWFDQMTAAAGVGGLRAVRWDTGGTQFNAMVAGFIGPCRRLYISDRVLDELPRSQIAMIVLHEVAHLRRRHIPIRILAVLPAWGAGHLAADFAETWTPTWASAIGLAVGLFITMGLLGFASRATEHDADRWACSAAERIARTGIAGVPADAESAAMALTTVLRRITGRDASDRRTWLHPSVQQRAETLNRCFRNPQSRPSRPRWVHRRIWAN